MSPSKLSSNVDPTDSPRSKGAHPSVQNHEAINKKKRKAAVAAISEPSASSASATDDQYCDTLDIEAITDASRVLYRDDIPISAREAITRLLGLAQCQAGEIGRLRGRLRDRANVVGDAMLASTVAAAAGEGITDTDDTVSDDAVGRDTSDDDIMSIEGDSEAALDTHADDGSSALASSLVHTSSVIDKDNTTTMGRWTAEGLPSCDPPFTTKGPLIGRRVILFDSEGEETFTTHGVLKGYIKIGTLDSNQCPAFLCSRTGNPSDLYWCSSGDESGFDVEGCELPGNGTHSNRSEVLRGVSPRRKKFVVFADEGEQVTAKTAYADVVMRQGMLVSKRVLVKQVPKIVSNTVTNFYHIPCTGLYEILSDHEWGMYCRLADLYVSMFDNGTTVVTELAPLCGGGGVGVGGVFFCGEYSSLDKRLKECVKSAVNSKFPGQADKLDANYDDYGEMYVVGIGCNVDGRAHQVQSVIVAIIPTTEKEGVDCMAEKNDPINQHEIPPVFYLFVIVNDTRLRLFLLQSVGMLCRFFYPLTYMKSALAQGCSTSDMRSLSVYKDELEFHEADWNVQHSKLRKLKTFFTSEDKLLLHRGYMFSPDNHDDDIGNVLRDVAYDASGQRGSWTMRRHSSRLLRKRNASEALENSIAVPIHVSDSYSEEFLGTHINDPLGEEKKYDAHWSDAEKCMFLHSFLLYRKDFRVISSFVRKDVKECINYYYGSKQKVPYEQASKEYRRWEKRLDDDVVNLDSIALALLEVGAISKDSKQTYSLPDLDLSNLTQSFRRLMCVVYERLTSTARM